MKDKGKRKKATCDCVELEEWAVLYVEGEVSEEIRQRLLIHIQSCAHCAHLVRSLKRTVHYCRIECGRDVPQQAHERLWQTIRNLLGSG